MTIHYTVVETGANGHASTITLLDIFEVVAHLENVKADVAVYRHDTIRVDDIDAEVELWTSEDEPEGDDYDDFLVADLQDILRDRDLPVSGTKDELIDRLREADAAPEPTD